MDLRHIDEARGTNVVELGVDLSEFYTSVEWDILEVPAIRYILFYTYSNVKHVSHSNLNNEGINNLSHGTGTFP